MRTHFVIIFMSLWSIAPTLLAQQTAPVGIQLYSFRDQFAKDVRGTMQKVKDMGFTRAEVAGTYGLSNEAFKALLDEFGIKAEGVGIGFDEMQDPTKVQTIAQQAKLFGAKYVICYWIGHKEYDFNIADTQKAIEVFNKAGKQLHDLGLSFLYHNHGYEFIPYQDHYLIDELIAKTNPLYVNFEMDVLWTYHPGHNPVEWLKKYPTRWKAIHLKDRKKGTKGNQLGNMDVENDVVLGTGDINLKDLMLQAKKQKINHFYIEDESPRSLEQVPLSIQFLRSIEE